MVECQWANTIGVSGEGHQADQVGKPTRQCSLAMHKFCRHIFDGGQPIHWLAIHLEVHRLHASRAIHNQLDRNPFRINRRYFSSQLRTRNTDNQQADCQQP